MELSKNYEHHDVEKKWATYWTKHNFFSSEPNQKEPYTIVMPPPNVTGVLHLGHTLNATIQDVLIRRARMKGYNACWVPGCDHASIATEAKVVEMLKKEKNIDKKNLTREQFLEYVFEWKEKYGSIIYQQLELLGCSVDWKRKTFTMDKHYEQAVIQTFVSLYNKGLIYKGARMINWDVQAQTALSNEEVVYQEIESQLVYLNYFFADNNGKPTSEYMTVATQRPETIMGDVAICVNPNDERYKKHKGRNVIVPLIDKVIPIIFDDYVDIDFGTGALKITPAHALQDYEIGLKHQLPIIDVLTEKGTISEAGKIYVGEERFEVRKKITQELQAKNFVQKTEMYKTNIGFSQRTNTIIEPRISTQWFLKTQTLNAEALESVETKKEVRIHPEEKFLNTYKHWMENPKDWCISRQLWWGQRIPAFYYKETCVVAENKNVAYEQLKKQFSEIQINDIVQDEDCLDTWFSSWIWPIEVFKGISEPNNKEFAYYYPTTILVTGQDIIFFWVARMIMAGIELKQTKPFDWVYFTGMVRDKQGRKMSKSLGNSPDLIALIKEYGADAVRFGVMISSPAGNDLLFDESALLQGKKFNNKLWNTLKLLHILQSKAAEKETSFNEQFAVQYFQHRIAQAKENIEQLYKQYKLSEILKTIYALIWDDFCSYYLEWIKPNVDEALSKNCMEQTEDFFQDLLQLLHPFMPFLSEELYQRVSVKKETDALCIKQFEPVQQYDIKIISSGDLLKTMLTSLIEYRNKNNISPKEALSIETEKQHEQTLLLSMPLLLKQGNIENLSFVSVPTKNSVPLLADRLQLFVLQKEQNKTTDLSELQKEYDHLKSFLQSVEAKLQNERFVANAKKEIIDLEKKKKADAIEKMQSLERTLYNTNKTP